VHILSIWYGTVLANTAVLCMHVRIICWYVITTLELCCDYVSLSSVVLLDTLQVILETILPANHLTGTNNHRFKQITLLAD